MAWKQIKRNWLMYMLVAPALIYFLVFRYWPMYGTLIAFKDFNPYLGMSDSPWVGFRYFQQFFSSIFFFRLIRNTILLNVYSIIVGFPAPIVLALLLNEVGRPLFKRVVQTMSYLPHFISVVVVAGIIVNFLSPTTGIVNVVIRNLGGEPISFMNQCEWFRSIYVLSGVWQEVGWGSIIYLAAMSAINPLLYDAAGIDGAGRWQKMRHITLPGIAPIIMILLLLRLGNMLTIGFEKVLLLYNPMTYEVADIISTYVYRSGLLEQQYSFATAVGLFNSAVNLILLVLFNHLARRAGQQTLW